MVLEIRFGRVTPLIHSQAESARLFVHGEHAAAQALKGPPG
jgi:hypothetical protein